MSLSAYNARRTAGIFRLQIYHFSDDRKADNLFAIKLGQIYLLLTGEFLFEASGKTGEKEGT
jgi:hypothetical protein